MKFTKDNLLQSLYEQCALSKPISKAVVKSVFELIKKTLDSGDDVLISGFGKFSTKKKSPRKGEPLPPERICRLVPGRWSLSSGRGF